MSTFHIDYENGNDANDGSDWANAWLTITTGATAARIAPDDEIRIAKSPDPVSIGDATWTDLSKTVTLAAALTLAVDQCESGWTAANSSTVTHPTDSFKQGSAAVNVTKSTYATGTLYAYKAITEEDFSDYTHLTLWVRVDAAVTDATRWVVCLCSDAAGATPVDSFAIPAIPAVNRWLPVRIAKTGGGALGASIQSVAIYSGAVAPANGQDIRVDNIQACTDFSLCSLISKSDAAQSTSEGWYGIQSIVGTTVLLDNDTETIATAGRGYSGTTEEVETFRRETIKVTMVASGFNAEEVQDSGTAGSPITFSGGWNTSSGLQDGESFLDGQCGGCNFALTSDSFITLERLSFARFAVAMRTSLGSNVVADLGTVCNCGNTVFAALNLSGAYFHVGFASVNNGTGPSSSGAIHAFGAGNHRIAGGDVKNNTAAGISSSSNAAEFDLGKCNNNSTYALQMGTGNGFQTALNRFAFDEIKDNATAAFANGGGVGLVAKVASITQATEFAGATAYADGRLYSHNHDGTTDHRIYTDGGQIDIEDTDFDAPAIGKMATLSITSATRTANYPLDFGRQQPEQFGVMAVVANKLVTVKAVLRKSHATDVDGWLVCWGGQLAGVPSDVVTVLADNTDEQELTITFTPTEAGVIKIGVRAAYSAGTGEVCIDRFTEMSQAA